MRIGAGTAREFVFMLFIITYWNIFIVYIYYTNQIKREYLCQFINSCILSHCLKHLLSEGSGVFGLQRFYSIILNVV